MTRQRVNYDQIAPEYDRRFASASPSGTEQGLLRLVRTSNSGRVLEVGCGTGHWLATLHSVAQEVYGLDLSLGMLRQARKQKQPIHLVSGTAVQLPFENNFFDLIFCINAIHHFDSQAFIHEAYRVLRADGILAVTGTDPHGHKDSWYGFDFFEGAYETDLRRFPAWTTVSDWMARIGFKKIKLQEVERIVELKRGRQVLDDPFLRKDACSRLALLSDEAYRAGMERLQVALSQAEARGETLLFHTDIAMSMLTGNKNG